MIPYQIKCFFEIFICSNQGRQGHKFFSKDKGQKGQKGPKGQKGQFIGVSGGHLTT